MTIVTLVSAMSKEGKTGQSSQIIIVKQTGSRELNVKIQVILWANILKRKKEKKEMKP